MQCPKCGFALQTDRLDRTTVRKAINKEMGGGLGSNHQTKCWNDALVRIKERLGL